MEQRGTLGSGETWPEYHTGSRVAFFLFLAYVVYWYLQGSFRIPQLGSIRFEFILGSVLSALAVLAYFANSKRASSGLGVWITLLFLTMGIMVAFSHVPSISFDIFIDRVFKFALLGFFIVAFVTDPKRLRWFIAAFLLACLKMEFEGVLGYLTGSMVWENQGTPRLHGATPNYEHPNSFSGMALGSLPFILYFFSGAPRYLRVVLLGQFMMALAVIVFTGSRTGYIGMGVGLLFLLLRSERKARALTLLIVGGLTLAAVVPHAYVERFDSIFTQEDKEGQSINLRKEILEDAWEVFTSRPLGVGVGAFPSVRKERFGRSQDTHNLYLEVGTNLGIQGLVVFGGLIMVLLRLLSRLESSIKRQILLLRGASKSNHNGTSDEIALHIRDLQTMSSAVVATYVFIMIRLGLGLFGMDLYEVYWWFASGTAVAVWNINAVAIRRTNILIEQLPPPIEIRPASKLPNVATGDGNHEMA